MVRLWSGNLLHIIHHPSSLRPADVLEADTTLHKLCPAIINKTLQAHIKKQRRKIRHTLQIQNELLIRNSEALRKICTVSPVRWAIERRFLGTQCQECRSTSLLNSAPSLSSEGLTAKIESGLINFQYFTTNENLMHYLWPRKCIWI